MKINLTESKVAEIINMYTKSHFSIKKIERALKINRRLISKLLNEKGIKVIDKETAMRIANTKHKRAEFDGNENSKAYLAGFVKGDMYVRKRSKYSLCLSTGTTHKAFLQLIHLLFDRYGHVCVYPTKHKKEYTWNISIDLDIKSFKFLLKLNKAKGLWPKCSFIHFLAGLIDSDGSIIIRKTGKYLQYVIRTFSQDRCLLHNLKKELEICGFKPILYINTERGTVKVSKNKVMISNKDDYVLEVCNKRDVIELLAKLPIKHPEKILWKELIFNLENKKLIYYTGVKETLEDVRNKISFDVRNFVNKAKEEYELKRKNKL